MVVLLGRFSDTLLRKCVFKQCHCVHLGAVFMALQDLHLLPCLRALSPHLPPTDTSIAGLHSGDLSRRIRCCYGVEGAPED